MAHTFDTGLQLAQRTVLRRAAVTLLSGLLRANGGYLNTVIAWGGVVRGYTDRDGIDLLYSALQGRAPAVAIGLGDRVPKAGGIGGVAWKGHIELIAYYCSTNQRDPALVDGRLEPDVVAAASDVADPGLDVIMEHVEELLVGQYPSTSKSIKQIAPGVEEELYTNEEVSLYRQTFHVQIDRVINPYRNVTQLLESVSALLRTSGAQDADPTAPPSHLPAGQIIKVESDS